MNDFQYTLDEVLLSVKGLNVSYDKPIIRDMSFEIRDIKRPGLTQGQKVGILAPSGMGKTTFFDRMAGLKPVDSGEILIGIDQKPVRAGMVGVVPQDYRLFEHLTVGESLTLAAGMREPNKKAATQKVLEILTDFNLADKMKSYPCELSGGQRQRVSIAEQLLSSKNFLLMDEPFSGLDILAKKIVADVIDRVSTRDDLNTTIFSTHDIDSAVMIADTIYILGRDHDVNGKPIPGARIQKTIDLIERNLAWHPDVEHRAGFAETVQEIKAIFPTL